MSPEPHWAGGEPATGNGGGAGSLSGLSDVTGSPDAGTGPVYDGTGDAPLVPVVTQANLDAILTSVAAVDWHVIGDPGEPPFENSFTNYASDWTPARYRITLNNVVYLEGLVKRTIPLEDPQDRGVTITMLPPEASPGTKLLFAAPGSGPSMSYIDITADGHVNWGGILSGQDAEGFLSLCGISYSKDGPSPVVQAALRR